MNGVTHRQRQQHHIPEAEEGLQGKVAADGGLQDEEVSAGQKRQVADPGHGTRVREPLRPDLA